MKLRACIKREHDGDDEHEHSGPTRAMFAKQPTEGGSGILPCCKDEHSDGGEREADPGCVVVTQSASDVLHPRGDVLGRGPHA
jgi:hypothetical protein